MPETADLVPPVLRTKLYTPAQPVDLVPRADLLARLDAGRTRPLTLVSAPTGYGKSVLISSWLAHSDWTSAWLSLDTGDGALRWFLSYFVSAVQTVVPTACESSQTLTTSRELPSVNAIAATLINELDALAQPLILVLDDYHRIDIKSPVHELLQLLLARPPIPLHLVVITRRDPPLPLAMLRAKDQMTEIRMLDLRFGTTHACSLLERAAGITPSEEALANLQRELEGWVAGLRLVSLALRHVEIPDEFLKKLRGGVQETQEYLVDEVLVNEPPELCDWLLKSAILERFCGSLCDAVCAEEGLGEAPDFDGAGFTRAVNNGNLFVIALDPQGRWFRYHHLFQSLLLDELTRRMASEEIAGLHARASEWFERQGMIDEAIRHALEAGQANSAAEIVERHWRAELDRDRWYVAKGWLEMLPPAKSQRAGLLLAELWIAIFQQQFTSLPSITEYLESQLDDRTSDPNYSQGLSFSHGLIDFWQGNSESSLTWLEKAVERIPEQPGVMEGDIVFYFGLALCMDGQQSLAIQKLDGLMLGGAHLPASYRSQLIGSQAFVYLLGGELRRAGERARKLAVLARGGRMANSEAWSDYLLACAHFHANGLQQASLHLSRAVRERYVLEPKGVLDALAGLALTRALSGQASEADKTLKQLEAFARERGETEYLTVAESCRARVQLLRGELAPAAQWARSLRPSPTPDELFTWLEVPSITRARVLVAVGSDQTLREAAQELEAIRRVSETCRFTGQTIDVAVLQALTLEKQGRGEDALQSLEEAVALAAPGGWVRPFVESAGPMAELIERFTKHKGVTGPLGRFVQDLRAAQTQPLAAPGRSTPATGVLPQEPLTRRELDILELLAKRLQNKEMAARLFVSPETVKTHLKHLYQKLGVTNRREAATKAVEMLDATRAVSPIGIHRDAK